MTISSTQGIAGTGQGSYVQQQQPEPVVTTTSAPQETTPDPAKTDSQIKQQNQNANQDPKEGISGEASEDAIKKAVSDINKRSQGTEAIFGIHEATNRVTIKILDKESKEVIKEIPAEKTLDLIAKAWEMAGIMVDEKR